MKTKIIISAIIIILLSATCSFYNLWQKEKKERQRNSDNVSTLSGEIKRYQYNDSLNVIENNALRFTIDELKAYRTSDAKIIKELKSRPKDIEYITTTVTETKDSIVFVPVNGIFHYSDKWATFDINTNDSSFNYSFSDSIKSFIKREYKHKFLWFRWGIKGYKITIVNFNPKSRIKYNDFIKVEK